MKISRSMLYKKVTRAAYLLSIIFLLAGMMLSLISQPAQASSAARPTAPVVRTPDGPLPTEATPPPSHNPDNPGVPGRRIPGRNVQSFNFTGQADAPNVPTPPVRLMLASGSVQFTQSNYCLSQAGPGWVTASVVVSIPPGETGILSRNWYVVHPNPYPDNPDYNNQQWLPNIEVTNGQTVSWDAWWPGASLWNGSNPEYATIEVHWGAQLLDTDGTPVGDPASLDAFFNGRCENRPSLTVSHACAVGGGIEWTAHNPGVNAVNFGYSITDGPSGNDTVPGGGQVTFATTTGGAHTATITYDNGQGTFVDATDSSAAGECQPIPALTVSHACGPDGVVFTASNPNSTAIPFTYTDGLTNGTATVSGNGSVDFLTLPRGTAHEVTITWDNGVGGQDSATDSSTAEECGTVALVINHQCKDGGGIIWNVYNPGATAVTFTWDLDSGQLTGSATVAAGQTVTATESSGGAHRLDVTWPDGSTFDTSTIEECGGAPNPVLTIGRQCITGGGIQWTVTNSGNVATSFTWTLDTDADSGSGSVGVGETVNVTTSTGGAHLLIVTWAGNSVNSQSDVQDCGGAESLTIAYQCAEGGGIQWSVSNSGSTALAFTWNLDLDAQTGSGTVPANGTIPVVVSTGGAHSLSIAWSGGSTSRTSLPEDCNPPQPITLGLRWQCSEDNTGVDWVVANNNPVEVTFSWRLDNQGESTTDTVAPNATKIFHTVSGHDSHTMTISWSDEIGVYSLTDTNPGNVCGVPEEPVLTVSDRCVLNNIEWTVHNSGNRAVEFEWNLDNNAQTGSDTAPASGRKVFLVTSNGQHTVTISWPQNNSFTHTTRTNRCGSVITTPSKEPGGGTPGTGGGTRVPGTFIPQTGGTPVPTLSAPGSPSITSGQGVAVSPVTGADLNALSTAALAQRLLTNLGLLFLGIALALTGFGSRMK